MIGAAERAEFLKLSSQIDGARAEAVPLHGEVLAAIQRKDAAAARKAMAQLIDDAWADIEGHMAQRDTNRRARQERQATEQGTE